MRARARGFSEAAPRPQRRTPAAPSCRRNLHRPCPHDPEGNAMSVSGYTPSGPVGRFVHRAEEIFIALILGAMTLITFANVVLRYGFAESLLWGQEVVEILFAWLVLFGISYGFKVTAHLGVDAIINMLSGGP